MDTLQWKRRNGDIIGCEIDGMELNLFGIMRNETLYELYHKQIEKDKENRDEYVS